MAQDALQPAIKKYFGGLKPVLLFLVATVFWRFDCICNKLPRNRRKKRAILCEMARCADG